MRRDLYGKRVRNIKWDGFNDRLLKNLLGNFLAKGDNLKSIKNIHVIIWF